MTHAQNMNYGFTYNWLMNKTIHMLSIWMGKIKYGLSVNENFEYIKRIEEGLYILPQNNCQNTSFKLKEKAKCRALFIAFFI